MRASPPGAAATDMMCREKPRRSGSNGGLRFVVVIVFAFLVLAVAQLPVLADPVSPDTPAAGVPLPKTRAERAPSEPAAKQKGQSKPKAKSKRPVPSDGDDPAVSQETDADGGKAKQGRSSKTSKRVREDKSRRGAKPADHKRDETPKDSETPTDSETSTDSEGESPEETVEDKKEPSAEERAAACVARLKTFGIDAEPADAPAGVKAECKIDVPVRLKSVAAHARAGSIVRFPAQPLVACRLAEVLGRWSSELAAPLVAGALRSELATIDTGPGFECRFRNRAKSGKLSAHANGLAVDIGDFRLTDGRTLRVGIAGTPATDAVLASLRTAACGWFTTILGPGSDEAHRLHLHFDVIQHGSSNRYRMCQ